ncbi:HD domain-containing protein [Hamadaea sp. NPDC051192]|uniref:HD domain-containing protein n=1 Tax=Hamadaea sp. NPDC051192 TaxID=3154940 RepID=UPI00342A3F64
MNEHLSSQSAAAPHGSGIAQFAFEMGVLKGVRRAGWWHAGIRDPESVAEHSLRVAQLAALIAAEEGGDPARAALLAIWHDSQETRTGDLPHTARPYLTGPEPQVITADQTATLPDRAGKTVREAVAEYESRSTTEAVCAHDADKLECLLQAVEYRTAGNGAVQGWIDSSRRALVTETARRIADAALEISPLSWRDR